MLSSFPNTAKNLNNHYHWQPTIGVNKFMLFDKFEMVVESERKSRQTKVKIDVYLADSLG